MGYGNVTVLLLYSSDCNSLPTFIREGHAKFQLEVRGFKDVIFFFPYPSSPVPKLRNPAKMLNTVPGTLKVPSHM